MEESTGTEGEEKKKTGKEGKGTSCAEKLKIEKKKRRDISSRMSDGVKRTLRYLPTFKVGLKSLEDRQT